ncbi:MAG: indole-3-glycerol phosphate synthase TrpC [Alphaproteobacteria bacterium GM7ARS4]|nr:indole-3-glycerol phosphate synthase TrpC [Alphaproteobacteria bacterium GM7ARS4]
MSHALTSILADKRRMLESVKREGSIPLPQAQHARRGFLRALKESKRERGWGLIAELKKASPKAGVIREAFDVRAIARAYEEGGATCLSVLTEETYFQGCCAFMPLVKDVSTLPILRKDFIIDPWQIEESLAYDADAILLIMAILDDRQARTLYDMARDGGMDVLVEVHTLEELERACALGTSLIGINNRHLGTLAVDLSVTEALLHAVPPSCFVISESGIKSYDDIKTLSSQGASGFLVGESLMRSHNLARAVRQLWGEGAEGP